MRAMGAVIDTAGVRYALDRSPGTYRPGEPLKLLLAGYSGTRNTGADVRVEEMIRQLRVVVGDDQLELSLLTIDPERSAGYFRTVRQLHLPPLFPRFLLEQCPRHHGVVACEGSMFKSKFANALTTMMAGSLGMAAAEGKLSVGYGAEAGAMDPALEDFVRKHCRHSLVICRNEPSQRILGSMGIRTRPGTDTAWTFEPAAASVGEQHLRKHGWDGRQPVLSVCPINPFYWPAKPDLLKAAARGLLGEFREDHYLSIYFHSWSEEAAQKYTAYLDGLAEAVEAFAAEHNVFVAIAGSEMLDRGACEDLAARLPAGAPLFVADDYDMYTLVSVLRRSSYMVSSRYHAMVTTMPGGVPSIGVTMDERIANLLTDRGHEEYLLRVDDPDLGEGLLEALRKMVPDAERVREQCLAFVPDQIRTMGEMGIDFMDELQRVYPDFPARDVPRSYEHFLPPLCADLQQLMERYPAGPALVSGVGTSP